MRDGQTTNEQLKIELLSQWKLEVVDRPTQLICTSDIYMSTDKYKRHSRAIC